MADPPTFDLQSHSRHSDGELEPGEVVGCAARVGVELLALSDHDTIDGLAEAEEAARRLGVRLVPAAEISAIDQGQGDLHILGYKIDYRDPVLAARLESYREERRMRVDAMLAALQELGFAVADSAIRARGRRGESVGRPHLAKAVVEHPANAGRLAAEDVADPATFLEAYLIEGKPAFRARKGPSIRECIDVIHAAGGLAVWAHPFFDIAEPPQVLASVQRFRSWGMDGVECFYITHNREQATALVACCEELGMLVTGSSDFHGPTHRDFSSFRAFSTFGLSPNLGRIGE